MASIPDRADAWPRRSPEQAGLDAAVLEQLAPQFEAWGEANLHAALIVRHGCLVYERYFAGDDWAWATPLGRVSYHAGLKHDIRSITKSVTSVLVGIALDRGWIPDLDQPVFDFFPEHADLRTPEKDQISVRHLLTMSAGLAWDETLPYRDPANSERRMIDAPDQCRYVLEQPVSRPAGRTYVYNGGLTALLAAIVQRRSGQAIEVIADKTLFAPLGITDVDWVRYAGGTANAASGLRMRPRDVAKLGQLVLNGGTWDGERIVGSTWIEQSLTPQINGLGLYFYGFQWWLGRSLVNRQAINWVAAVGYGGQRMYIVPSLDMVVVVMAGLYGNPILQNIVGEVILRRYALQACLGQS